MGDSLGIVTPLRPTAGPSNILGGVGIPAVVRGVDSLVVVTHRLVVVGPTRPTAPVVDVGIVSGVESSIMSHPAVGAAAQAQPQLIGHEGVVGQLLLPKGGYNITSLS